MQNFLRHKRFTAPDAALAGLAGLADILLKPIARRVRDGAQDHHRAMIVDLDVPPALGHGATLAGGPKRSQIGNGHAAVINMGAQRATCRHDAAPDSLAPSTLAMRFLTLETP